MDGFPQQESSILGKISQLSYNLPFPANRDQDPTPP
jgi:hypothetical protein